MLLCMSRSMLCCSNQLSLHESDLVTAGVPTLRRSGTPCTVATIDLVRNRMLPAWSRPEVLLRLPLSFARAISRRAATSAPFVGSLHWHHWVVILQMLQQTGISLLL